MQVEQIDRDAAASGYYAWCSGNPVIPERMTAGTADDHSMVQAFARHRHQARAEVVGEIVAWLRGGGNWCEPMPCCLGEEYPSIANEIEAKFGGRD